MRRITSIILTITFLVLSASGLQMSFGTKPQNLSQQPAGNPNSAISTVKREMPIYPKKAHEWAGYLFIAGGLVHLVLNRRPMLSYLRCGKKQ